MTGWGRGQGSWDGRRGKPCIKYVLNPHASPDVEGVHTICSSFPLNLVVLRQGVVTAHPSSVHVNLVLAIVSS